LDYTPDIKALKSGSQEAFRMLVKQFQNQVYTTCFGFVHNLHDAEDIAQDVFVEVFESISGFNEDSMLSTWIYRIAVNKSLDSIRRKKRKKRWAELTRISSENTEDENKWFQHDNNPQLSMEQLERVKILNMAIDSLPVNQRKAFTLHKYDELSYAEIATIMEVTISSVESLMHRAKDNLKKRLTNFYLS